MPHRLDSGCGIPHTAVNRCCHFVLNLYMASEDAQDLPFRIEQWDDADSRVEELIALVGDHRVAMAAFTEAVKRRPGRIVILRQKTRVLADSRNG